jgi:hypothetical protein
VHKEEKGGGKKERKKRRERRERREWHISFPKLNSKVHNE